MEIKGRRRGEDFKEDFGVVEVVVEEEEEVKES